MAKDMRMKERKATCKENSIQTRWLRLMGLLSLQKETSRDATMTTRKTKKRCRLLIRKSRRESKLTMKTMTRLKLRERSTQRKSAMQRCKEYYNRLHPSNITTQKATASPRKDTSKWRAASDSLTRRA